MALGSEVCVFFSGGCGDRELRRIWVLIQNPVLVLCWFGQEVGPLWSPLV